MSNGTRVTLRAGVLALAAAALLAAGAAFTYIVLRPGHPADGSQRGTNASPPAAASGPAAPAGGAASSEISISLTAEAIERAGIRIGPVRSEGAGPMLRLPGVIEADAYRQVSVTPLTAGRVTRVLAELGEEVRRGQALAEVFSPELAEAHTRYTAVRAELEAHDRELQRTARLVEIGAASRQELERLHAEHTAQVAGLQSARSRLELLGVAPAVLDSAAAQQSTTIVPAPINGVVTERRANPGLNVSADEALFTVVDLSGVWVVADVYEKDLGRVAVGSPATVTTSAYPDLALTGRVSYIDPRLNDATRTARLRVEVPNPRRELRLGMYADVHIGGQHEASTLRVPRGAVQVAGDRHVVYVADPQQQGRFTEREVRIARPAGDSVEVVSGIGPADAVVTEGSFFVRAEIERLGIRRADRREGPPDGAAATPAAQETRSKPQTATIRVTEQGFEPAKVTLRAGVPARLTFLRTTDKTCGTEVVFPSLGLERALPLNQPVTIELTPKKGDIAFSCGMNMLRGAIVAE